MNEEIISDECIICPMCKHEHDEWWLYTDIENEDHNIEINCEHCDWFFVVRIRVFRTFESINFF
jgi:uncharacterized protein YbaR (Trm112 family)